MTCNTLRRRLASFRGLMACLLLVSGGTAFAAEEAPALRSHERWIWTELIAFDNEQPDLGVGQYLETTGFTPTAICILIGSPDFMLSHTDMETEVNLPAEFCSRDGHEFNQERSRQAWTNHQVRALNRELHKRGVESYLSVFTKYTRDPTHREWITDHLEVLQVHKSSGFVWAPNPLARLKDGTYFEEVFARKTVKTLQDYEFDGWHGADGWGPLSRPVHQVSFSDDMIDQFADMPGVALPDVVTQECVYDVPKLEARAEFILRNRRAEWSAFYAQRWARFWTTMVTALHDAGKKATINSAWGRAPFEAYYRYGVDYQRIAATGVDAIIVETVAAGLAMDPRMAGTDRHDDFLAMLMLMRACVPDTKLIFLHNVHDVVEEWDAIRHMPTVLEREIYALNNVFHTRPDGTLRPSADGFLACLGDGLTREEWGWLKQRWERALFPLPTRTLGATVVWSDAAYRAQTADFLATRTWDTHYLLFRLMEAGATVQGTINVNSLENHRGALLVPNAHLFPPEELARVMAYGGGPVVLVGRKINGLPEPALEFSDVYPPNELWCAVYNGTAPAVEIAADGEEIPLGDLSAIPGPEGFWDHMSYRKVSADFVTACATTLQSVSMPIIVDKQDEDVDIMPVELADGTLRIAIKNRIAAYARPEIDMGRPIASAEVRSGFPSVAIRPKGGKFDVRVPGRGITVVDVKFKAE